MTADAGDGVERRDADGMDKLVSLELDRPDDRTVRGVDGAPLGTWGESETGWWGSANCDVQTFDSEAEAKAWVLGELAGKGNVLR